MKYKNLTLLTLNNTLHIKADNLEPVEVDSSCSNDFYDIAQRNYISNSLGHLHPQWHEDIRKGINISELSDRIEVRNVAGCQPCEYHKAFLLPEKEDKQFPNQDWTKPCKCSNEETTGEMWCCNNCGNPTNKHKSYTIEEIEKAIDKYFEGSILDRSHVKEEIINNLKK